MNNWYRTAEKEKGVLIGSDCHQEWLLPWWWERYSAENAFPVAFIDFGMTDAAKQWCAERGEIIPFSFDSSLTTHEKVYLNALQNWEKLRNSSLWKGNYGLSLPMVNPYGFKKLQACLFSPYQNSVWLDLDCEILGPIDNLFSQCCSHAEIALCRDFKMEHLHEGKFYNTGVIAFKHGSPIMQKWAEISTRRCGCFWREDLILSTLFNKCNFSINELPSIYNWNIYFGLNMNAVIYHWSEEWGKTYIKNYGGIRTLLKQAISNPNNEES
jgi:hypothetical protein